MTDEEKQLHVWNIEEQLILHRIIKIYGEIDNKMAYAITAYLDVLSANSDDPIILDICTPGGSILDGLAIVDKIKEISCPVIAVIHGVSASFGNVISSACDKTFISPNSWICLHQEQISSAETSKSYPDIMHDSLFNTKLNDQIINLICKKMGMKPSDFKKKTDRDWWLDAQDAKKYHIVDDILPVANKNQEAIQKTFDKLRGK